MGQPLDASAAALSSLIAIRRRHTNRVLGQIHRADGVHACLAAKVARAERGSLLKFIDKEKQSSSRRKTRGRLTTARLTPMHPDRRRARTTLGRTAMTAWTNGLVQTTRRCHRRRKSERAHPPVSDGPRSASRTSTPARQVSTTVRKLSAMRQVPRETPLVHLTCNVGFQEETVLASQEETPM